MKKFFLFLFLFVSCALFGAPKAVVFDFGGVLASPDDRLVKGFIMETFRFPFSELDDIKKQRAAALDSGLSEAEFWTKLAESKNLTLKENWHEDFQALIKKSLNVNDEMFKLIRELKEKNILIGLLSNIDHKAAKLVRDCGLYLPFEPCLLSCEIGADKPDQKAYEILIEKLSMLPRDVVFIDDLVENIDAARKAGIDAILYQSATQIREELQKRGLIVD